ncbi:MAG: MFS transporter [Steroidobacteraceae bacterium]
MSRPSFRLFLLLAACAATGPLQLNVYLPSLPLVQADFGASVADVQWTVSLPMVAFGLGLVLFGPLSDRLGRRPVLLAGLCLFTLASVFGAIAGGVWTLAIARALQSAGASVVFITARAVVADLTPREQLQRSVAQLTMIVLMGQMVAPLLGNLAMSFGGWRVIQYLLIASGVGLTAVVATRLPETLQRAPDTSRFGLGSLVLPTIELLSKPGFRLQLSQIGLLYAAYPAFVSIAPHLMIAVFHRPPTEYGYYFAMLPLGYFAGNAFVLRYGQRFHQSQLIRGGSLLAGGGSLLAAALLALVVNHPAALFVPFGLVANFALGLSLPSATARAIGHAWPNTASAWGLAGFSQQVLGACIVQVLGFFPAETPYPMLLLCAAVATMPAVLERWHRTAEPVR